MFRTHTLLCTLVVFASQCGATGEDCTEPHATSPETSSLLQAKVSMESALHSEALEIAESVKEIRKKPLHAAQLLENFASNVVETDMALDNKTWSVIRQINETLQDIVKKAITDDHDLDVKALTDEITISTDACTKKQSDDMASDKDEGKQASDLGAVHRTSRVSLKAAIGNRSSLCNLMKSTVLGVPSYPCKPPPAPVDNFELPASRVVQEYRKKLELAVAALAPYDAQQHNCATAIDKQEQIRVSSNEKQTKFESAMCSWRMASYETCLSYDMCYQTVGDTLSSQDHWLVARVKHRKLEWEAVHRIQCTLNVLVVDTASHTSASRKDMLNECHAATVSVGHLDIAIPALPDQQPCDLSPKTYPGTADFVDTWYKDGNGALYPDLAPVANCTDLPAKYDAVLKK